MPNAQCSCNAHLLTHSVTHNLRATQIMACAPLVLVLPSQQREIGNVASQDVPRVPLTIDGGVHF